MMTDVYRYGYITFVATVPANSNESCFRSVSDRIKPKEFRRAPSVLVKEHFRWKYPLHTGYIKFASRFPLLQRAWVYQERQSSARTVHFTYRQLLWECKECLKYEGGALDYSVYGEPNFGGTIVKRNPEHHIPAWQRT